MKTSFSGTKGRTLPQLMDKSFYNDFEAGTQDTYILVAEDVGELLLIKLEHDMTGIYSDWFVERVLITCSHDAGRLYEFPCGHWVQKESLFFEGRGTLDALYRFRFLL